jgi:hypothetical protein
MDDYERDVPWGGCVQPEHRELEHGVGQPHVLSQEELEVLEKLEPAAATEVSAPLSRARFEPFEGRDLP